MASVAEKLRALNDADLSKLRAKLDGLRKDLEKALAQQSKSPTATATATATGTSQTGVTVEELIAALEAARQRGFL